MYNTSQPMQDHRFFTYFSNLTEETKEYVLTENY